MVEVNGLQQQKTKSGSISVSEERNMRLELAQTKKKNLSYQKKRKKSLAFSLVCSVFFISFSHIQ